MVRLLISALGLAILVSCQPAGKKYVKSYFDFDSLIHTQERLLKKSYASVTKQAEVNGHKQTVTFVPDTTQWKNELEIFSQIDIINKPSFKAAYDIKVGVKDTSSNLVVKAYKAKVNSPVPYVHLFYQKDINKLRKIEARFQEQNALFSTVRYLTLEFDQINGQTTLEKYAMHGVQKMILTDSTSFDIEGRITITSNQ